MTVILLKRLLAASVNLASLASALAADSTVTALPPATTPLTGSELIYCVQGGTDRKCLAKDIIATPVTDGKSAPAGAVGEVLSVAVPCESAVTQPAPDTPVNISSVTLTNGAWLCNGAVWTNPGEGTTTTGVYGALSTTAGKLPSLGAVAMSQSSAPIGAGVGQSVNFGPAIYNVSASTPLYLVGNSGFVGSTMGLYGAVQCQRFR